MTLLAPGPVAAAAHDPRADARPDRGLDPCDRGGPCGRRAVGERGRAAGRVPARRGHGVGRSSRPHPIPERRSRCRESSVRPTSSGRGTSPGEPERSPPRRRARSPRSPTRSRRGSPQPGGQDEPGGAARGRARRLLHDVARGRADAGRDASRAASTSAAVITMDEVEGKGHQIVHSAIDVRGAVPRAGRGRLRRRRSRPPIAGCPFSALLRAARVGIDIETTLEDGGD